MRAPPLLTTRLVAAALVVLLLVGVASPASATERERRIEGATIRWDEGLDGLARQAAEALPRIRDEVAGRLGWAYEGPEVTLVLVHGLDRTREATGAHVPDWAVGVAVSSRSLIVIRSDLLARGFGGGIEPVMRHEWVHLTWGWKAGSKRRLLPLWAEEGIAEDIGGGISVDAGAALDLAVTFGDLLVFETLERSFPAGAKDADLAYKQSRSWIRHVTSRVGWKPLQDVLHGLVGEPAEGRRGESPFETQIRLHTDRSVGSWHATWVAQLEEEAAPWYHLLLRDFQGLILAGLAVLGIVTGVLLIRRRRRQIEALPDDAAG